MELKDISTLPQKGWLTNGSFVLAKGCNILWNSKVKCAELEMILAALDGIMLSSLLKRNLQTKIAYHLLYLYILLCNWLTVTFAIYAHSVSKCLKPGMGLMSHSKHSYTLGQQRCNSNLVALRSPLSLVSRGSAGCQEQYITAPQGMWHLCHLLHLERALW